MDVEEEGEALGEFLRIAAAPDQLVHIGKPIGERVGHLLDRIAAGIAHMRPSDRNRVEARRCSVGVEDGISRQPH